MNWIKENVSRVITVAGFLAVMVGGIDWYIAQKALAEQVQQNKTQITKVQAKMELDKITGIYYESKRTAKSNPDDDEAQEEYEDLKARRNQLKAIIRGK